MGVENLHRLTRSECGTGAGNHPIKLKKDQRSGTYIVTGFSGRGGR